MQKKLIVAITSAIQAYTQQEQVESTQTFVIPTCQMSLWRFFGHTQLLNSRAHWGVRVRTKHN
jgi:hypothetical protein